MLGWIGFWQYGERSELSRYQRAMRPRWPGMYACMYVHHILCTLHFKAKISVVLFSVLYVHTFTYIHTYIHNIHMYVHLLFLQEALKRVLHSLACQKHRILIQLKAGTYTYIHRFAFIPSIWPRQIVQVNYNVSHVALYLHKYNIQTHSIFIRVCMYVCMYV